MNEIPPERSFDVIPDELIIRTLHFCTCTDILSFAATCRRYSSIAAGSVSLQLHIELEANGLQITQKGSRSEGDYSLLLKQLQQYRDEWLDLDLSIAVRHHSADEEMLLWELRDGLFAKGFELFSSPDSNPNSILFSSLDARHAPTQAHFGASFSEFTADMSQELVVLVGLGPRGSHHAWVRICSSATGQAHPLAKYPTLSVRLGLLVPFHIAFSLGLEIVDEVIVVKFASPPNRLYEILIWNWKTGALLNRISCENGICDFVFLDSDRLVLWSACSADGGSDLVFARLLIYDQIRIARAAHVLTDDGMFDIPAFPRLSAAMVFEFPKLPRYSALSPRGFLVRSDPGPGRNYTASTPFSNSKAITLGLTMSVMDSTSLNHLHVFVDVSQLLDHLQQSSQRSVSTLSWDAWGENATRWFHAEQEVNHWICWMFGSRFVTALKSDRPSEEYISVVEFHSPTIRRHSNRVGDTYVASSEDIIERQQRILDGQWPHFPDHEEFQPSSDGPHAPTNPSLEKNAVIVDVVGPETPTTITLFEQLIISRLPYRIVTRAGPVESHEGWLIDGSHIIGMDFNYGEGSEYNWMTVYTLGRSAVEPTEIAPLREKGLKSVVFNGCTNNNKKVQLDGLEAVPGWRDALSMIITQSTPDDRL